MSETQTQIRYLDVAVVIEAETPLPLRAGWGDRVSRQEDGPCVYGDIQDEAGALYVEAGQRGEWWERQPVTLRATRGGYETTISEELRAAVLATHAAVVDAWQRALEAHPEIAAAVEAFRGIEDRILRDHDAHQARWARDVRVIARRFRRAWVEVGEQTVPGRCCVRGRRGALLGYAMIQDGVWTGEVVRG